MRDAARQQAAACLAEAFETGNPLAALPDELVPASPAEGGDVAALVLEQLGLVACGIRLAHGPDGKAPLAGPMLEARLLPGGVCLPLAALRHAQATAALVAVLAEALPEHGEGLPALAAVHPAIDVAGSRFRDSPASLGLFAADLCGLGHVVAGRGGDLPDGAVAVTLAEARRRPCGEPVDLRAALAAAMDAARRSAGGLPAGAVVVVTGLSRPVVPEAGLSLAASFAGLGRVKLDFA
jgi:2-keto-4-pentenoate hydratase